jgi:hypothetical protein
MNDFDPATRALFDQAREELKPNDDDRDRLRARILGAAVGGTIVGATTGAAGAGAATAAGAAGPMGIAPIVKIGIAVVLAGAIATGAWLGSRPPTEEPESVAPVALSAPDAVPEEEHNDLGPDTVEPEAEAPASADRPVEVRAHRRARARPRVTETAAPESAPAEEPASTDYDESGLLAEQLRAETRLLRVALDHLRDGDAEAALAATVEHRRRFPDGLLSRERAQADRRARCALGQMDACP